MKQIFTLRVIPILIICLMSVCVLYAQDGFNPLNEQHRLGIYGIYAPPTPALDAVNYEPAVGLAMEYLSPALTTRGPLLLQAGLHFDYMGAGNRKADVTLLVPAGAPGDIRVKNMQMGMEGMLRLGFSNHYFIRPYFDLLLGTRFWGVEERARIHAPAPGNNEDCDTYMASSDWNFSAGLSGGLLVRLTNQMDLDFRASYRGTSDGTFADLSSFTRTEDYITYPLTTANASQWFVQVGINFMIDMEGSCTPNRADLREVNIESTSMRSLRISSPVRP